MRKIKSLLILLSMLIVVSCEQEAKLTPTSTSSAAAVDYEFTIKLNGVTHSVQGNTSTTPNIMNNMCYSSKQIPLGTTIQLSIVDVSAPDYVSGQNLSFSISFDNLLLAPSLASVTSLHTGQNSYMSSFVNGLNAYNVGFTQISSQSTIDQSPVPLTFNITDLGTPTVQNTSPSSININDFYNFGQTLKGSFVGTAWLLSSSLPRKYDIPFQLEINFEVLRYVY